MKNLFRAYKDWRDKKFIERIDRVYFKKDKDENHFIKGNVVVEGFRSKRDRRTQSKSPVSKKKSK